MKPSKNRMLRLATDIGPFTLSASFAFNKVTGEWDVPDSFFIDARGKEGTEISGHLDEMGRQISRWAKGRDRE
ncbi:MAG: hypothetical protein EBR82_36000 [Caulobacteraceae bacterium]|nr:hypothetical protein [Caulobacteraceae bacterium]